MTAITIIQAAELTGVSRTTLWRAVKKGKISATKTENGGYLIDVSELERTYPMKPRSGFMAEPVKRHATTTEKVEMLVLQAKLETAEQRIRDLEQDRDHWREAATTSLRLLTDQRPIDTKKPLRRRFLGIF